MDSTREIKWFIEGTGESQILSQIKFPNNVTTKLSLDLSIVNHRIEYVRINLGYSESQFVRKMSKNLSTLRNLIGPNQSVPSYGFLEDVIKTFPVQRIWLFTGEGDLWRVSESDLMKYIYSESQGLIIGYKKGPALDMSKRFRDLRETFKVTQGDFANELNIPRDVVAAIDNLRQNVPIYTMKNLHKVKKVNLNWLITGTGEKFISSPIHLKNKR